MHRYCHAETVLLLSNFSRLVTVVAANTGNDLAPSVVGAARRLRIVATRHVSA
jgi:hypothetical protein